MKHLKVREIFNALVLFSNHATVTEEWKFNLDSEFIGHN